MRVLFLLLLIQPALRAQTPTLKAELAHREAFLGDAVNLRVSVRYDPDVWQSVAPSQDLDAKLGEASVLTSRISDPLVDDEISLVTVTQDITLSWYELGAQKVPAIAWTATAQSGETETFETVPLNIEIIPILEEGDQEIAPGKDQIGLERPALWPWILGGVLILAGIIAAIVFLLRRGQKPDAPPPPEPLLPPYEEALAALENLTHSSLMKEGRVKEFYVAINLIVRRYYSRLFEIGAEEMTSFEVEEWIEGEPRMSEEAEQLNNAFQETCDRVKYAKFDPVEATNRETVNRAYQIVEILKPLSREEADVATG